MASGGEAHVARSERRRGKGVADLTPDAGSPRRAMSDDGRLQRLEGETAELSGSLQQ